MPWILTPHGRISFENRKTYEAWRDAFLKALFGRERA